MIDPTRRKLTIPNWFSPYLEKHRIYELFHELARELLIQEPADHVLFLREILYNASNSRFAPRIILIAPPKVNIYDIAKRLGVKTKAAVITEEDFVSPLGEFYVRPEANKLNKLLYNSLRTENTYYNGWILPDYPKTPKEAKLMQQSGILPTHVLLFVPQFTLDLYDFHHDKKDEIWMKYRRSTLALRSIFKHQIKEVYMANRTKHELIDVCVNLINIRKRYKSPLIPRICLLGPRGSGRKTQARKLVQSLNLVHVEFEYLLCQNWISETHLGSLLRAQKDDIGYCSLLLTALVHKRILEIDCIERGWVLTGFPNTLDDLKNLEMLDTPPNRIIYLECDLNLCIERLAHRRIDTFSATVTNLLADASRSLDPYLKLHPRDRDATINAALDFYCQNYETMRKHSGNHSFVVDGSQPVQWVSEIISAIIMRPLPEAEVKLDEDIVSGATQATDDDSYMECTCSPCTTPFVKSDAKSDDISI